MAAIILFIVAGVYSYRHKKEILREVYPEMFENPKKQGARSAKPRPNAKSKSFHGKHGPVSEEPVKRTPKSNVESNRAKRRRLAKEAHEECEEEARISDITMDTKGTPLSAMALNGFGTLLMCSGKNHQSFLFAVAGLDYQMLPFVQQFTLDEGDISALASLQPPERFLIVYAESGKKELAASTITFDEEAKAVCTKAEFKAPGFKQNVQRLYCSLNGKYVMTLADRQVVRVYDETGEVMHELVMPEKKCADMCVTADFKRVAVACGSSVEIYDIVETPIVSLQLYHKLKCNAAVVSMSWAKKTSQLVVASAEGLITVFKSDPKQGVSLKFNSTGVRIVRVSPESEYLAIISGKSKLQIVRIDTGSLYSCLQTVHHGEAHFLEWSLNGKWLFVASRQEPNIEGFHFVPRDD